MEETAMTEKGISLKRIAAVLGFAALTAVTGVAQAHEGGWDGGHCGKHQHHMFQRLGKKLGLTDTQKAQAKEIFQANKETLKPIITKLRAERKNLHLLMTADKTDEPAIRAETAKIAAIQADLNVNRAKVGAQFRSILTPEQQTALKTMIQKHQNKTDMTGTPPADE
jgi:periplasmic protein CpxP/Spy